MAVVFFLVCSVSFLHKSQLLSIVMAAESLSKDSGRRKGGQNSSDLFKLRVSRKVEREFSDTDRGCCVAVPDADWPAFPQRPERRRLSQTRLVTSFLPSPPHLPEGKLSGASSEFLERGPFAHIARGSGGKGRSCQSCSASTRPDSET